MPRFRLVLDGKSYDVTIDDPTAQPLRVIVDGEMFEVEWTALEAAPISPPPPASKVIGEFDRVIKAPMPGVINKISVQPGDRVEAGQELCVLEAMKMNNVIRAPGPGQIAQVRVTLKQSVQHGDVLMVFAAGGGG